MKKLIVPIIVLYLLFSPSCEKRKNDKKAETEQSSSEESKKQDEDSINRFKGKKINVVILYDGKSERPSFNDAVEGFKTTLTDILATRGATIEFHLFRTFSDVGKVPQLIGNIKSINPSLICNLGDPSVFADKNFVKQLPEYKFVSLNPIPVRSGIIESWEHPGGNVTGVGVFLQYNSSIRLIKKINPNVNKVLCFSWDAVGILNDYLEEEIRRSCKEERVELVEFRRVPHIEAQQAFYEEYKDKGDEYVFLGGISSYIHKDGTPVENVFKLEGEWYRENMSFPMITWDETNVVNGCLAGTCLVWYDIGVQLAEKGFRILKGENPGEIAWDYPRKYNVMLNLQRAKDLGIEIPNEVISGAYRVYTDYNGNYVGRDK